MLYLSAVYIHRVHIKKGATDFFTMTYKYAQISMIFGTQLCKWILIILVNLHFVPCISLTWWCNGDVMLTSLKSCHFPCTWHCHRAAEREREREMSRVMWPSNSPYLNLMDYSIWGILQERVYHLRIHDVKELKERLLSEWRLLDHAHHHCASNCAVV